MAAAVFAAFSPALQNDFVNWDDWDNFTQNTAFRGLGWAQLKWMLTTFHLGHYQPLSWLSLGLNHAAGGLNPFGYHLVNIALHCANACLFFELARLLLAPASGGGRRELAAAAGAAALFALHPLRVESVVWATERRDVLSAFFYLACLLLYLHATRAEASRKRRLLEAALGVYACAVLSKVLALTLPAALLAVDLALGRLPPRLNDWGRPESRPVLREKLPFLALAVLTGVIGLLAQQATATLVALSDFGWPSRLAQAACGLAFYPWKTLLPAGLSPWYDDGYLLQRPWLQAAGWALLATGLLAARRGVGRAGAAWAFYLAAIFPTLGLVKSARQVVADRFSYIPCLGLALLAGAALSYALKRAPRLAAAAAAAALLALGGLTWRQSHIWRDTETLWRRAVEVVPDSGFARMNLGLALLQTGKPAEALLFLDNELKLARTPLEKERAAAVAARAHNNVAVDLSQAGRLEEAISHMRLSLSLQPRPGLPETHNNLGILLARAGRRAEAEERFREALRLNPGYREAQRNLRRLKWGGP